MAGLGTLGGGGLFAGKSLAVLGAGLLAGAVGGGALVVSDAVQFGGTQGGTTGGGPGLEIVPCPGQGPAIGSIPRDQEVLVTGRSADGGWLQIHWPVPGIEYGWTKAGPLQLRGGDPASLRVAGCEAPPARTPRPTVEPTPEPTAEPTPTPTPTPTPSPGPTPTSGPTAKPTPTPKPTAKPTPTPTPKPNTAPKLSGLKASPTTISFDPGKFCATDPKGTTISVAATDADGIASATLYFRRPGTTTYVQKPMALSNGQYVATLNTTADKLSKAGELRYYVVVRDANAKPKSTRSPASGTLPVTVKVCAAAGPEFTLLRASPTSIISNPLNAVCKGSTLSELTAQASDPDGVTAIRLFYTRPGYRGTSTRDFTRDGDTWYSFINTVESVDGIARPGTITWYAVATDGTGLTTQSPAATIDVGYCDSPASFDFSGLTGRAFNDAACSPNEITIPVYASDPDNELAGDDDSSRVSVVVTWSASNGQSGHAQASFQKGNYFLASFSVVGWAPGTFTISWSATSTDLWGGTTKSFAANSRFSVLACAPSSFNPGSVPEGPG